MGFVVGTEVRAGKELKGPTIYKAWVGWVVMWGCLTLGAGAQQGVQTTIAPSEWDGSVVGGQTVNGQVGGVIFGSVSDSDGDLVPGARVVLTCGDGKERTTITHSDGRFAFSGVPAGAFEMTATAKGLAPGKLSGTLEPGAVFDAPAIRLGSATANTELTVTPQTEHEIAEEEVRTEEKQRVLGIVPNFFVTYEANPVPLSAKQKYRLGFGRWWIQFTLRLRRPQRVWSR